jgi:hypothetical protein
MLSGKLLVCNDELGFAYRCAEFLSIERVSVCNYDRLGCGAFHQLINAYWLAVALLQQNRLGLRFGGFLLMCYHLPD